MREHTGPAIGVAAVAVVFMIAFGGVLVALGWIALSVYALVKAIGSAPDAASPTTVLLIVVGLVTALAVSLGGAIALVGKSMTPRKRRKGDAGQLAFDIDATT
jgi:hypothetical protein